MEIAKQSVMQRQHIATRLSQIFSAILFKEALPAENSFFYTVKEDDKKNGELRFIFDNGIDPEPSFSGPVRAKLYIDPKNNLILSIEPLNKSSYRKETLYRHVSKIEWEFLAGRDAKFSDKEATPINASYEWRSCWPKEKPNFPSLIRLNLTEIISEKGQKEENLKFAFFLPIEQPIVTYTEEKVAVK